MEPGMSPATQYALQQELQRARTNFPGNDDRLAAFVEEVGELAKALLDQKYGKDTNAHVREEAIQAAAMAIRLIEEGDSAFPYNPLVLEDPLP